MELYIFSLLAMPAYSFKERFVPMVEDGSKDHTIRALRKGKSGHAMPGQTCYLYYGMRTKFCRKIGEGECTQQEPILITPHNILVGDTMLDKNERDRLAWRDGFRPQGSTIDKPDGAFDLLVSYWQAENTLPWKGVIIHWKLKK